MPRYLVTWELDSTRIPMDPNERVGMWGPMLDMVEEDMKSGVIKDWASYVGTGGGMAIGEGTEVEIATMFQKYVPFVQFTVYPLMSLSDNRELMKNLSK